MRFCRGREESLPQQKWQKSFLKRTVFANCHAFRATRPRDAHAFQEQRQSNWRQTRCFATRHSVKVQVTRGHLQTPRDSAPSDVARINTGKTGFSLCSAKETVAVRQERFSKHSVGALFAYI